MSDAFQITPYQVRSAGTDVPPEEVQRAINDLAHQTQIALNSVASDPTGPAGGDLSGTYPNPTVAAVHATSGTISGVAVTGSTINSSPVGATTPATGAFTTTTTGSLFASGGAVPAVTASGTQIYNSPNPTVQFIDSIRSANNKNAFMQWGLTVLSVGFANDTFTSFTNALTITGGQGIGISGITSSSGTGAWAHTGGFSATNINSTPIGATTPNTGAFTTLTASSGINSTTIGATTPATGKFTSLQATGTITPSSTAGIAGTTTNDNANTGSVGEYLTAVGGAVGATTGVVLNATSVALTAGDWDVWGACQFTPAGTMTLWLAGISPTSATRPAGVGGEQVSQFSTTASQVMSTPVQRVSLASGGTAFLTVMAQFTTTLTVTGTIYARRVR